jgi:hypothetical protein
LEENIESPFLAVFIPFGVLFRFDFGVLRAEAGSAAGEDGDAFGGAGIFGRGTGGEGSGGEA